MTTTTRWEIVARKGEKSIRLAFSARKTRESLRANMFAKADNIVADLGTDGEALIHTQTREAITLTDGTVITWSGRTELECQFVTWSAAKAAHEAMGA